MISNHLSNLVITATTTVMLVAGADEVATIALDKTMPPIVEGSAVMPDYVEAGGTYIVLWDIVKRTACNGENSRVWSGADGFHLVEPKRPTGLPTSHEVQSYRVETMIPEYAGIGELSLRISGWYQCPGSDREYFTLGPVTTTVVDGDDIIGSE